MERKEPIYLYTDGAASGNPGPGGWGAVLVCGNLRKEIHHMQFRETHILHMTDHMVQRSIVGVKVVFRSCGIERYHDPFLTVHAGEAFDDLIRILAVGRAYDLRFNRNRMLFVNRCFLH